MNAVSTLGDDPTEWVPSFAAVAMLRKVGIEDKMTLAHWAEDRLLRTRAGITRCDGDEHSFDCAPDIPADYWRWVHSDPNAYANWDAGVFAATVIYEPASGIHSDRDHWRVSYVTFHAGDLAKLLSAGFTFPPSPQPAQPSNQIQNARGAGRRPNAKSWEKLAAAMAVLIKKGEVDLSNQSENQAHEIIASFLMGRGHEDALGVDTMRTVLRRYKAWAANETYSDDYVEKNN